MEIGKVNRARVDAVMPQGFYLELETGGRILLPGNKNQFSLEEGEMAVSYDYAGLKQPLLTVRGGESLEETGGYAETGTVYVILESTGKCVNGSFDFTFAHDTP